MIIRKKVRYTADFEAFIEYDDEKEDEQDAVSNIDIPEGGKSKVSYRMNTFNVLEVIPLTASPE